MSSSTVKIKVSIKTNKIGSECTNIVELDAEEWAEMHDGEREAMCRDIAFESMDWNWKEVE